MRRGGVIRTNETVDEHVYDKWEVYVGRKGNRIASSYINSYCDVIQEVSSSNRAFVINDLFLGAYVLQDSN